MGCIYLMVLFEKIEEYNSNLPWKLHLLESSRLFIARKWYYNKTHIAAFSPSKIFVQEPEAVGSVKLNLSAL